MDNADHRIGDRHFRPARAGSLTFGAVFALGGSLAVAASDAPAVVRVAGVAAVAAALAGVVYAYTSSVRIRDGVLTVRMFGSARLQTARWRAEERRTPAGFFGTMGVVFVCDEKTPNRLVGIPLNLFRRQDRLDLRHVLGLP